MHKVIVLYNTPADPQPFRSYYEKQHLSLVARLPGLRSTRYSCAIRGPGGAAPFLGGCRRLIYRHRSEEWRQGGRDKSLHALEKYMQLKTVWRAVDSPP